MTKLTLLLCVTRLALAADFVMPPKVHKGTPKECEITADRKPTDAKVRAPDTTALGKMVVGGGGWKTDLYKDPFVKGVLEKSPEGDVVPLISSAAQTPEGAGGGYGSWYNAFQGKVKVRPIFTTTGPAKTVTIRPPAAGTAATKFEETKLDPNGSTSSLRTSPETAKGSSAPAIDVSTDPNEQGNLEAIRQAKTAIVIDGGQLGSLAHIAGTKLAEEIQKAYRRGVTVYVSSEGANAAAAANASFLWPRDRANLRQLPSLVPGLAVTNDFAVSSHIKDPRLIAKLGFGTETVNGNVSDFVATNPYAFLDPLRQLKAEYPSFGIPERAVMYYEKGIADFKGEDPLHRFYIVDPRYPVTDMCDYYYVLSGARYDLKSAKVIPPVPPGLESLATPGGGNH